MCGSLIDIDSRCRVFTHYLPIIIMRASGGGIYGTFVLLVRKKCHFFVFSYRIFVTFGRHLSNHVLLYFDAVNGDGLIVRYRFIRLHIDEYGSIIRR